MVGKMEKNMDTEDKAFNIMELSPGAERLLLTLIYYAGTKGVCYPSQATLMKAIGINNKYALKKYVEELRKHNLVSCKTQLTSRKIHVGKTIPARQINYSLVSCKLYFTNSDDSNRLYLNLSSRKLHPATLQNTTGTIHNTVSKDTVDKQKDPLIQKSSLMSYKELISSFNRKYSTNLFPTAAKQTKAIKSILNGFTVNEMWQCAEWLLKDSFWSSKGFDFVTILSQIAKWKQTITTKQEGGRHYVDAKTVNTTSF